MRICIVGAGAIGGFVGARLAAADVAEVSLVARGPHLAAIQAGGLTLRTAEGETNVRLVATDRPAELPPQDYIFLALKAHSVPAILDAMLPLLDPDTAVVTAQNGVPWWYFHRHGGVHEGRHIDAVDPGGRIWSTLGPERAIGCVVYPAAEIEAPGVIRHVEGDRLPLGEPAGGTSDRVAGLASMFVAAGLRAAVRPSIRTDIWVKLWGNLSFNPISALTGGTLAEITGDPATRALTRSMMVEAEAIAGALGVRMPIDVDKRIAGAEAVGAHKTSMLQDLERGRPLEIDALVTAVQELGRLTAIPTPTIDGVLALVRQRARLLGLYPEAGPAA